MEKPSHPTIPISLLAPVRFMTIELTLVEDLIGLLWKRFCRNGDYNFHHYTISPQRAAK